MMKFLTNKKVLISYFTILMIALGLSITGYSFTLDAIDILLWVIVVVYPIVRFFAAKINVWIKVVAVLAVVIFAFVVGEGLLVAWAFTSESRKEIGSWRLKNKKIIETRRQGWSGPEYTRYDMMELKIFGLFSKTIAYGYRDFKSSDECSVKFSKNSYDDTTTTYMFNKCTRVLVRVL